MIIAKRTDNLAIFGKIPERPIHLSVKPLAVNEKFLCNSAVLKQMEMILEFENGTFALPFTAAIPKSNLPCPAVIVISEEQDSSKTTSEWISKGFAVISLYYKNISENNGNFKSGISAHISPSRRKKSSAGKIAVWSWAAIRVLECAEVFDEIDKMNIGITGRGIFALSALYAKEMCPRFAFINTENLPMTSENLVQSDPHLFSSGISKRSF